MSFLSDLRTFVLSRPAFYSPIGEDPTQPVVLNACCFYQAPQNVAPPFLVWRGPYSYDHGNFSGGADGQKKAVYYFTAYQQHVDDASTWIQAIADDLSSLWVPGYFIDSTVEGYSSLSCRFTQMLPKGETFMLGEADEVIQTAEEFPTSSATIGITIGWQE